MFSCIALKLFFPDGIPLTKHQSSWELMDEDLISCVEIQQAFISSVYET